MLSMRAVVAIVVLPSLLAGMALAAQDRYSLQVPGGLAFSDFRGYEDWQVSPLLITAIRSKRSSAIL